MTVPKELTPEQYLFYTQLHMFEVTHKKKPSKHEKLTMLAKAKYDYKNMSTPDKLTLERYVKKVNEIAKKADVKK